MHNENSNQERADYLEKIKFARLYVRRNVILLIEYWNWNFNVAFLDDQTRVF